MSDNRSTSASRRTAKANTLPARPDLAQLRAQSKDLLARLRDGEIAAARDFIAHLPEAQALTPKRVRQAGYRLADAQSVIARRSGFGSWPALSRHVSLLRALDGEWAFRSLEVDGSAVPSAMLGVARILIDGDRFRTESAEATYDGEFLIDVEATPCTIDIRFIEGPEAGRQSLGIFVLDTDTLTICLGLTGAPRPRAFRSTAGSQHALETLQRVTRARPDGVTGGRAPEASAQRSAAKVTANPTLTASGASGFVSSPSPLDAALAGSWSAVSLIRDGKALPEQWLAFGRRELHEDELRVIFGGQVMVHARVRHDARPTPAHVDYLHRSGEAAGHVTYGICELRDDELWVNMSPVGAERPTDWLSESGSGRSFSRWRRTEAEAAVRR